MGGGGSGGILPQKRGGGSGGILPQKNFKFGGSETLFSALAMSYVSEKSTNKCLFPTSC